MKRSFQTTIAEALANGTPYNPTGDLISREALKEEIASYDREFAPDWVLNLIDNAPPVEPDVETNTEVLIKDAYDHGYTDGWKERFGEPDGRPKGEWIKEDNGKTTDVYRCSICGRSIMLCKNADLSKYPFCHCGANMRKGGAE